MKRVILVAIFIAMLMPVLSGVMVVNGQAVVSVTVDGKKVVFPDAKPFIDENGRTLIPVRFVTEDLGANVDWNKENKEVSITKDDIKILIKINQSQIFINDQMKTMDTKAIIKDDRTYVPIRYIAEGLGANVDWDKTSKTVIITTTTELKPTPIPGVFITPTPKPTSEPYDPQKWVTVDEKAQFAELIVSFYWSNNRERYLADCEYAESVIASKYDEAIAKEIIDMVRNRTERIDDFRKTIKYNGRQVDIISTGGVIIHFWEEGINPR